MTLQYRRGTPTLKEIEDKLQSLSLDYQKEEITVDLPVLVDGKEKIEGKEAILAHLEILEKELHAWYYCDC